MDVAHNGPLGDLNEIEFIDSNENEELGNEVYTILLNIFGFTSYMFTVYIS